MRNKAVDIVRGLGILAIIFIHVTAWFTFDKTAAFVWNWGQFAVPAFVFCSTYLFFVKKDQYGQEGFVNYSLRRLRRLLPPYYWWLLGFFLIYVFKDVTKIHWQSVLTQLTLTTSGIEPNWAILLFVYVTILMFPLLRLWRRARVFFILYVVLSLASSLLLLKYPWPFNYKLIMWLPWSLIIFFSWYFATYEKRKFFYPLTFLLTGTVFLLLSFSNNLLGNSFLFFKNKYPPNLYFLSYGIFVITLIYYLAKRGFLDYFHRPIHFLSLYSYPIFFIHLLLIIAASEFMNIQRLTWWVFLIIILVLTVIVQLGLVKLGNYGKRKVENPSA